MLTVTASQIEQIQKIVRRVDRKLSFEAHHMTDGSIAINLSQGKHKTETRLAPAALEASADDVMQFENLRRQIRRVCDRMWAPPPPVKAPRVEIQRDLMFTPRPGGNRGRR